MRYSNPIKFYFIFSLVHRQRRIKISSIVQNPHLSNISYLTSNKATILHTNVKSFQPFAVYFSYFLYVSGKKTYYKKAYFTIGNTSNKLF